MNKVDVKQLGVPVNGGLARQSTSVKSAARPEQRVRRMNG